jgi:Ricin-type beta-trefoil lectin domain
VDGAVIKTLCLWALLIGACLHCGLDVYAAQLIGTRSGECVNLPEPAYAAIEGTAVRLLQCLGKANQQWRVVNGQIISSVGPCLDVLGSAGSEGARIIVAPCTGNASQQWIITNGQINGIGGYCLDTRDGGSSDRTPLILSGCSGAPSQQWSVR